MSKVSSILDKIYNLSRDNSSRIYLMCDPYDRDSKRTMCSAKIIIKKESELFDLSEWFNIPIDNIKKSINGYISGVFLIPVDQLEENERKNIVDESKPLFNISKRFESDIFRWLDDLYIIFCKIMY